MPYTRYRCAHCPETFPLTVEGRPTLLSYVLGRDTYPVRTILGLAA